MTNHQFLEMGPSPILKLNKNIGANQTRELLKVITKDSEGEIIEVQPIYRSGKSFWVKIENVDLLDIPEQYGQNNT